MVGFLEYYTVKRRVFGAKLVGKNAPKLFSPKKAFILTINRIFRGWGLSICYPLV